MDAVYMVLMAAIQQTDNFFIIVVHIWKPKHRVMKNSSEISNNKILCLIGELNGYILVKPLSERLLNADITK